MVVVFTLCLYWLYSCAMISVYIEKKSKDSESKPFGIIPRELVDPHLKPMSGPWLHNPHYMFLCVTGFPFTSARTSTCGAVKQRSTNSTLVHVSGHVSTRRSQNRREFSIRKTTLQSDEDRTSRTMVVGSKVKSSRMLSPWINQGLFSGTNDWLEFNNSMSWFKSNFGGELQRSSAFKGLIRLNALPLHMAYLALLNVIPYKESTTGLPCITIEWASIKLKVTSLEHAVTIAAWVGAGRPT